MILEEGGGGIENTTLFGKYQVCRILGRGRSGTVYLARHKDLDEYRAIKQVPKTCTDYGQFRQEALIMKTLRHPGIPIVYDLEEDEHFSYLIEEFLEGDSLYALISDMGHFSKAMTIRYGIQICCLVYTLHIARPYPILYLDLQPKNLLLCDDTIKLVDFDHAIHLPETERLTKRYGTIGCAAPEQYTGEALDERTDIYAIGAVLYYMLTGQYPGETPAYSQNGIDKKLARILRTCLQRDREKRYDSAKCLCEELEQILTKEQGVFNKNQVSSLTIAIAGTRSGVGTTHIAMGLVAYLRRQGFLALYEEVNDSGGVLRFADFVSAKADQSGIFRIKGVPMLPRYGVAVRLEPHLYPVVIKDFGANPQAICEGFFDGVLVVYSGKPWEREITKDTIDSLGIHPGQAIIYNHFCRQLHQKLPGPAKETGVFLMPHCSNPFNVEGETERFYQSVLLFLLKKETGGWLQRLKRRIRRKL